jgi:predicted HAD superfamily phosphohydrolase
VLVGRGSDRVEGVDVLGEPVGDGIALTFERAEEAVPDDQDAAVVAVQVLAIAPVMDPVMRGRVEHLLERTEPTDRVRVDPVLVQEVDPTGRGDQLGLNAQECQGAVGQERANRVGDRLP